MWNFIKECLSEGGLGSSMRLNQSWITFWFTLAVTFGYIYVVFRFPSLIMELSVILVGGILAIAGVKAYQKTKEAQE